MEPAGLFKKFILLLAVLTACPKANTQTNDTVFLNIGRDKNILQVINTKTGEIGTVFNTAGFRYLYNKKIDCVLAVGLHSYDIHAGKKAEFRILHPFTGANIVSFIYNPEVHHFGIEISSRDLCRVYHYRHKTKKTVVTYLGTLKNQQFQAYKKPKKKVKKGHPTPKPI